MDPQNPDITGNDPSINQSGSPDITPPAQPVSSGFGGFPSSQAGPAVVSPDIRPAVVPAVPDPTPVLSGDAGYGAPATANTSVAPAAGDEYISNPFLNAVRGLVFTLKNNPTPALLSGLIGVLIVGIGFLLNLLILFTLKSPAIDVLFFIILVVVYIIPIGSYYVIAGASARGETITTGEAYSRAIAKLLPFIGLCIITGILTIICFLLLIIPGIIFMARSSLSPLILFEEDLGPIAALKRSFSLTKGHLNEMLGALFASSFLGGGNGLLFGAISVAPLVGRYHDLRQLKESGAPKPKVHWLNYTYVLFILLFVGVGAFAIAGVHKLSTANTTVQTPGVFNYPTTSN